MTQKYETQYLGKVCNHEHLQTVVAIHGASLALGSTAIGLYVSLMIGGEIGKTVGDLVSAFAATVAYGEVKSLAVELDLVGQVNIKYLKRRHRALLVA
jgi:hypothetical protein